MSPNFLPILPNSDFEIPADLILIAIGFTGPRQTPLLKQLQEAGVQYDDRGNIKASFGSGAEPFKTSAPGIYACGDVRRGQSIIVWAISEGRKCADIVHRELQVKAN